jgi:hypothetical protein
VQTANATGVSPSGSPAIIGPCTPREARKSRLHTLRSPVDRWLCVPTFQ